MASHQYTAFSHTDDFKKVIAYTLLNASVGTGFVIFTETISAIHRKMLHYYNFSIYQCQNANALLNEHRVHHDLPQT